jgi:predicted nucleic acid-binding protein
MESFLQQFAIILVNRALCRIWASVAEQAHRKGRPIIAADAWIAATAISLRAPLVTHNPDDYAGVDDLVLLEPEGSQ